MEYVIREDGVEKGRAATFEGAVSHVFDLARQTVHVRHIGTFTCESESPDGDTNLLFVIEVS